VNDSTLPGYAEAKGGVRDASGVQTGELVLVTIDGIERLHNVPRGFARV
jgi:hypothetical protein